MENPESAESQPPPPPPPDTPREQAQMSELATIGNIFFEPGRTFEDLRRKPRFLMATVIIALLVTAYQFALYYKVGEKGVREFVVEQLDKSGRVDSMDAEQKSKMVDIQMTVAKVTRYAMPIFVAIALLIGGLLYWAAAKAFGGDGGFLHGWSVWVYSSLPPTVVAMVANFLVLALKPVNEIDIATSQRGVLHANPSFFIDGKASPVLATLLSTFDLFAIWGWVLAAIGLRITNRLSSGSAWAIVIMFTLIFLAIRVVLALVGGNPT
jgi:hypothetical protein